MVTPTLSPGSPDGPREPAYAVLTAVVLLTVPLVGCTGDGDSAGGAPSGDVFAAQEGLDAADAEAEAWAEDPEIVSVVTFEAGPEGDPDQKPPTAIEWTLDDPPGDGLAHAWQYTYIDADEERLNVYVNAEGETQTKDIVRSLASDPIGEWDLSSEEAAEIAQENDEFSSILQAEDAEVITDLGTGVSEPEWWFNAKSETQDEEVTVAVNAVTGESRSS